METLAYRNGELLAPELLNERAFVYGDGVFETMRCVNGQIPLLPYHLARLARASDVLHLKYSQDLVLSYLQEAIDQYACKDCVVKLIVSRQAETRASYALQNKGCNFYIILKPYYPKPYCNDGVSLISVPTPLAFRPQYAGLKLTSRLDYILPTLEMTLSDEQEALFFDNDGAVVETMHHNIFFFLDDTWVTSELKHHGVHGVFRSVLLDDCIKQTPLKSVIRCVSRDEMKKSTAAFICNAIDGMVLVNDIDGFTFSSQAKCFSELKKVCEKIFE